MGHVTRSEGILLSEFEKLDAVSQEQKWTELKKLVAQRKGPLRIDRRTSDDGATSLVYVRERTLREFFIEKIFLALMAPEQLAQREDDARTAIAQAFGPYFDRTMRALEASEASTPHAFMPGAIDVEMHTNSQSHGKCRLYNDATGITEESIYSNWTQVIQLQDAVLDGIPSSHPVVDTITAVNSGTSASEVELMPMHGLRKCRPGLSVVPFSPLTFRCDCLLTCNTLRKSSSYDSGDAFVRMNNAYENALCQYTPDLEELHLTSVEGLRHVKHLWLIPDFVKWDEHEKAHHDMDDWEDFYLDLFMKAAQTVPYGSTVLEPWPSYWTTEGGASKPVWTDANVHGLAAAALKARHGCLKSRPMLLSVTLAITDTELRERVERELVEQEGSLLLAS